MSGEKSFTEDLKRYQASVEKAIASNVAVEHSPSDCPVSDQEKGET